MTGMALNHAHDRAAAVAWARGLLGRSDWVLLDFETTGMNRSAEIVEIGVMAPGGSTRMQTLVKPSGPIPPEVQAIHHITDDMVSEAPPFKTVYSELAALLRTGVVVTYNVQFDQGILAQTCARYGLPMIQTEWSCAMLQYAAYCGVVRAGTSYSYQRLPGAGHRAIGDCRVTLQLIETMATSTALCMCRSCQRARAALASATVPAEPAQPARPAR